MPTVALYNISGEQVGELELSEDIFGFEVNEAILHDAVVAQLARRRLGTHDTKTRSEVRGGGRKPWRQKGTGRARVGSIRSPIWRGGGTVFGPHPRDYGYSLPRKVRRQALKSALSAKVNAGDIVVIGFEPDPNFLVCHFNMVLLFARLADSSVKIPHVRQPAWQPSTSLALS